MVAVFTVGRTYQEAFPEEDSNSVDIIDAGVKYQYLGPESGHLLILGFPAPTFDEIDAVRKGRFELRVLGNDLIMLLLLRVAGAKDPKNGIPWCDARCEWSRVAPNDRVVPPDDANLRWLILLVDSDTQVVRAIRMIAPSEEFQRKINEALRLLAAREVAPTSAEVQRYLEAMEKFSSKELAEIAAGNLPFDPSSGGGFNFVTSTFHSKRN